MLPVTSEGSSVQSRFCVKALMHNQTLWVLNVLNLHVKIRRSQVRAGYAMQNNDIIVNATKGIVWSPFIISHSYLVSNNTLLVQIQVLPWCRLKARLHFTGLKTV